MSHTNWLTMKKLQANKDFAAVRDANLRPWLEGPWSCALGRGSRWAESRWGEEGLCVGQEQRSQSLGPVLAAGSSVCLFLTWAHVGYILTVEFTVGPAVEQGPSGWVRGLECRQGCLACRVGGGVCVCVCWRARDVMCGPAAGLGGSTRWVQGPVYGGCCKQHLG